MGKNIEIRCVNSNRDCEFPLGITLAGLEMLKEVITELDEVAKKYVAIQVQKFKWIKTGFYLQFLIPSTPQDGSSQKKIGSILYESVLYE